MHAHHLPRIFPRRPYGAAAAAASPLFLSVAEITMRVVLHRESAQGVNLLIVYMHLSGSIGIDAHFDNMLLPSCLAVRTLGINNNNIIFCFDFVLGQTTLLNI
jgi:hypothetical protein